MVFSLNLVLYLFEGAKPAPWKKKLNCMIKYQCIGM